MRILAIRGRNLASLENEFAVDFTKEPLASAGIFAISGPTGAGKSTLLDAMCLALFSRTPRTDQAKEVSVKLKDVNEDFLVQGDPRFLLRRGTASGYAEVDFVALDGCRYRARWAVSRARDKENGRLQSPRITLSNLDTRQEEQGSRGDLQNRIIELIGLTFDQFTRSVLLAQNDFSTFLKAEQGEKAALLEKLTGTGLYSDISRLIYQKNGEAKEEYERLRAQVDGIALLSEEEERALRIRLTEAEAMLMRVEKAKMERQALRDAVRSADLQIKAKQSQQKEVSERLEQAAGLLRASREEYERDEQELVKSEELFSQLQVELRQARKLDVRLEAEARLETEANSHQKEVASRKKEIEEKVRLLDVRQKQGNADWSRLQDWRERYRAKEPIAEQLSVLLVHLDTAATARLSVERSDKAQASLRQDMARLETRKCALERDLEGHKKELERVLEQQKKIEEALGAVNPEELDKTIESCRQEREGLLVEQAQFVSTGDIKALRDKLTAGTPCPVCGSADHPFASYASHARLLALADRIAASTLRLQVLIRQKDQYGTWQKELSELRQKELSVRKMVATDENVSAESVNQLRSIAEQIKREEEFKREQQENQSRSFSAANLLFGNDIWQAAWMKDPDGFRKTLTDFASQWHENTERMRQLERDRGAWQAERESYESFLPALREQYEQSTAAYAEKHAAYVRSSMERARFFEGKAADVVEMEFQHRVAALRVSLRKSQEAQQSQTATVEQLRGVMEQIAKDLAEIAQVAARSQQELERWEADYTASSEGKILEESLPVYTSQKTECEFRLRTHTENKRKIAGFQQELDNKRVVSERWAKLNDLAGSADGGKFRRVAQGYTLDVLIGYANVQLRLLTKRYRLERVSDTLALQVIDQDMCDETRTVHSLSGGESFLVSLALALGLSALSSNRMNVESLFIDEGFGSLDAETLRVAMDALESLRTQGRKIGVISHVQEMTERVPVQVKVNRAGNGRSYIEVI